MVGCYDDSKGTYHMTERAQEIDQQSQGKLTHMINV